MPSRIAERSRWRRIAVRLWLPAALLACAPARADGLEFAEYRLGRVGDIYELDVRLTGALIPSETVTLPPRCEPLSSSGENLQGRARITLRFRCVNGLAPDDVLSAPWGADGGVFRSRLGGGEGVSRMLHGDESGVRLPIGEVVPGERPLPQVAAEYVRQGVIHILGGFDHLAFVLCLCLLTRGRQLLWRVTAFTLGHSVSLAAAFLGFVRLPVPPVEAVIALSIAFMAREALLIQDGQALSVGARRRQIVVVAVFGLLHGLGFASVLGELGVSASERIAGLMFFNVGVEIGQLLFVAVVLTAMAGLRYAGLATFSRVVLLCGVGAVSLFWTSERLANIVAGSA